MTPDDMGFILKPKISYRKFVFHSFWNPNMLIHVYTYASPRVSIVFISQK